MHSRQTYYPHGAECSRNILLRYSFQVNFIQQRVFSTIKSIFDVALGINLAAFVQRDFSPILSSEHKLAPSRYQEVQGSL